MMELLQETFRPDGNIGAINANGVAGRFFDITAGATTGWIGGMPVGLASTAGLLTGATALGGTTASVTSSNFIGILWNNSWIDTARGSGVNARVTDRTTAIPTIVVPPCKVRLFSGTAQADASLGTIGGAPFMLDAWVVGDLVYISSAGTALDCGKWTRTKGAGSYARAYGRVLEVVGSPVTSITVLFWSFMQGAAETIVP
jgi:hypothetical protein